MNQQRRRLTAEDVFEELEGLAYRLARIEGKIDNFMRAETDRFKMAQSDIDNLQAKVEKMSTVVDSAVASFQEVAQMIRDNQDDPQELQALATKLEEKAEALAGAIIKGTKAENTEPPVS